MGDTTYATATTKRCYATMGEILPQLDIKPDSNEKTKAAKQIIKKNLANKHRMNIEPMPLIDSPKVHPIVTDKIKDCFNPDQVLTGTLGGLSYTSIKVLPKPIRLIKKVVDTINVFSASPKIQLFPNPVASNSRLNIKLNNIRQGDYLLSLMSMSGIILQNQEVRIDAEINIVNMDLKSISAGTYIVRIIDRSNGKSITQKLVVL